MAIASEAAMEDQIPSSPQIIGKIRMKPVWKTRVRIMAIIADTGPSLSAVKNPDPKIAIPEKRNTGEQYLIA